VKTLQLSLTQLKVLGSNMRVLTIIVSAFILIGFSGCTKKVYIDVPVYVDVPVKCETPKTFCSEEGSLREGTIEELLMCISELRESNKGCR